MCPEINNFLKFEFVYILACHTFGIWEIRTLYVMYYKTTREFSNDVHCPFDKKW